MSKKRQSTSGKYLSRLLVVVCIGVFIYAAYGLINVFLEYNQGKEVASEVQATYHRAAPSSAKKEPRKKVKQEKELTVDPKFDDLLEENKDVVGWIAIDDTTIDYPILQSEDNLDYLTKDFNKDKFVGGSIFLDYRNNVKSLSRNTVVYGHRMKDGSMFEHLIKFMDEDFFKNHQTFEIETLYETYEAEIFSVYNTTTDFNYIMTDFSNDDKYAEFLTNVQNESTFETDVEVDITDRIITLSTCDYELDANEGRLVIQAKLIKK